MDQQFEQIDSSMLAGAEGGFADQSVDQMQQQKQQL